MSRLGTRFLSLFLLLLGLAAFVIGSWELGRWIAPAVFGPLPPWLPEDLWLGLGYETAAIVLGLVPTLSFTALLLASSYRIKAEDLPPGRTGPLVHLAVLGILFTVVYAALNLLAAPWVDAQRADLQFRSQQTAQLEQAYKDLKDKDLNAQTPTVLQARLSLIQRLALLRPMQSQMPGETLDYDFELQILKAHFDLDNYFRLRALAGVAEAPDEAQASVEDLLARAEAALARPEGEQEYQANLWGYLAYRRLSNALDQGRPYDARALDRAKAVVDTSWARIYEKTLAADERLRSSYFFRKGKSLGDYQFQNYLEAYYGFEELRTENPRDAEVERYAALSLEKATDQVLFREDMDVLFQVPGVDDLAFINRIGPTELVRIGRLLDTNHGVYVKDVEFLRFNDEGKVLLHWTAPYGRWTDAGIDFRVWDKDKPVARFPTVLAETEDNRYDPLGSVDPPLFRPAVTVRELLAIDHHQPQPQTLGTWDLLIHGQAIAALGANPILFQTEFVSRLAAPLGVFLAFLVVFALAWPHRVPEPGRRWWHLILILPPALEFFVQVAQWAFRLGIGGLLQVWGLEWTVGLLLGGFALAASAAVVWVQSAWNHSLEPAA